MEGKEIQVDEKLKKMLHELLDLFIHGLIQPFVNIAFLPGYFFIKNYFHS